MQYDSMQIIYEQMLAKYKTYIFSHFNCMKLISRFIRKMGGKKHIAVFVTKKKSFKSVIQVLFNFYMSHLYTFKQFKVE